MLLPRVIGQPVLAQNPEDRNMLEGRFIAIVLGTSGG